MSFDVHAGEIVCIAGIEGNGQTELVYGLTGLEPLKGGTIELCGRDITHASIRERSRAGMSHIPEDRHKHANQGLNPGLLHCNWILYQLSLKGSPRTLEWVAYLFSRGSSRPRHPTGISCIAGKFFTN